MLEMSPKYTSQRCPKCGRIRKANRHHDTHEYVCDACGYEDIDSGESVAYLGKVTMKTPLAAILQKEAEKRRCV